MTNKDVFKILLCTYGYDRNIKIDTFRGEGGCMGYEIYAENKDGDSYEEENCEGLMFNIYQILDFMKENKVGFKSDWWNCKAKDISNDNIRASIIESWDISDNRVQDFIIATRPLDEWRKKNNPCPECKINKHDHWDIVHYNCELCHNSSCEIMRKFDSDYDKFRDEFMKKNPVYAWRPTNSK